MVRPNKIKKQLITPPASFFGAALFFTIYYFLIFVYKKRGAFHEFNVMLSNTCNRPFHTTILVNADPVSVNVITGPQHATNTNRYKISLQLIQTEELVACLI